MPDLLIFHSFLYIKSNQLLSWKTSTQRSELHFGRMLLNTGKPLNPHPVPVLLLQQLVNLKLVLPWSTSSDTYCKPLLSNKRFQNNQILSGEKIQLEAPTSILEICSYRSTLQSSSNSTTQCQSAVPASVLLPQQGSSTRCCPFAS